MRPALIGTLLAVVHAVPMFAQDKVIKLVTTTEAEESGLLDYILPRFRLKTGIAVEVVTGEDGDLIALSDGADLLLADLPDAEGKPVMYAADAAESGGDAYVVALLPDADPENASRLADWLVSDVGQNTLAAYQVEGAQLFLPFAEVSPPVVEVVLDGDAAAGEKLAHFACGRCHVVSDKNRMGGIGSTPSFPAMRNFADWKEKFLGFYVLNPHPSFTQVADVTEPFPADRMPHIAPVELTLDEIDAIAAFVATITPKDLGGEVQSQ
jgi:mono/diheme cytochrome c family protein